MAKRFLPESFEANKRPKLDNNRQSKSDTWGDDNEDEILLLASQALEKDVSVLPEYELWNKPSTSSTQLLTFKKPHANNFQVPFDESFNVANNVQEPSEHVSTENGDISKEVKRLRLANEKLKHENHKLMEKCLTSEGEASILRSQLRSQEANIEKTRMDLMRTEQMLKSDMNEKLSMTNKDLANFKTQLEFKELELVNLKEKCRNLENNKVKISSSQRFTANESFSGMRAKHKTAEREKITTKPMPIQTDIPKTLCLLAAQNAELKANFVLGTVVTDILQSQNSNWVATFKVNSQYSFPETKYKIGFKYIGGNELTHNYKVMNMKEVWEHFRYVKSNTNCWDGNCYASCKIIECTILWLQTYIDYLKPEKCMNVDMDFWKIEGKSLSNSEKILHEEAIPLRRICNAINILNSNSPTFFLNLLKPCKIDEDKPEISYMDAVERTLEAICKVGYTPKNIILTYTLMKYLKILSRENRQSAAILSLLKKMASTTPPLFLLDIYLEVVLLICRHVNFFEKCCSASASDSLNESLVGKKSQCNLSKLIAQIHTVVKSINTAKHIELCLAIIDKAIRIHNACFDRTQNLFTTPKRCDCLGKQVDLCLYSIQKVSTLLDDRQYVQEKEPLRYIRSICIRGCVVLQAYSLVDGEFFLKLKHSEGRLVQFVHNISDHSEFLQCTEIFGQFIAELKTSMTPVIEEEKKVTFSDKHWIEAFQTIKLSSYG